MSESRVEQWFGSRFSELHPLLQHLHLHGGELIGLVDVDIPSGIAGVFGRRLAKKLGVPPYGGQYPFRVAISHQADGMYWDRCFGDASFMRSLFQPVGAWPDGYWLEETGPLQMRLTVDVKEGERARWQAQRGAATAGRDRALPHGRTAAADAR